jgi:hypothetical protein
MKLFLVGQLISQTDSNEFVEQMEKETINKIYKRKVCAGLQMAVRLIQ